jgi:starvation-inducible DNA-binding protein
MRSTQNTLNGDARGKSIILLGTGAINALDLERQAKQAHWNIRGPNFIALHELFDKVAAAAREAADECAERAVALGGEADSRSQSVGNRTALPAYPTGVNSEKGHVEQVVRAIAALSDITRHAIDDAAGWGDQATSDLFTQITRGLDQHLWMVEAHLG